AQELALPQLTTQPPCGQSASHAVTSAQFNVQCLPVHVSVQYVPAGQSHVAPSAQSRDVIPPPPRPAPAPVRWLGSQSRTHEEPAMHAAATTAEPRSR